MTERRNPGCAFGPCNESVQVGGVGCHLCDDIATLPQRGRGVTIDSDATPDGGVDDTLKLTSEPSAEKTKKVRKAVPRKSKGGGPSLF